MSMFFRACALMIACVLAAPAGAQASRSADYIAALVNSEPITHGEIQAEVRRTQQAMAQAGQQAGAPEVLRTQVLERMLNERAQLQMARELGYRVDDSLLDVAEQSIARQNGIDLPTLYQRLASEGLNRTSFRARLRDQQLLTQLHGREVESRIRISETDVDDYLRQLLAQQNDPLTQEINLAQLLVAVPEKASAEQAAQLYLQAQRLRERALAGEDFAQLVREHSSAERKDGGAMGLRRGDKLPSAFLAAAKELPVGGVSDIVRSGAGFHILKVLERRAATTVTRTVVQTRARHILLRPSPSLSQAAALERLAAVRKRILSGATSFAAAARDMSQDGSADNGGDLGWANPGMFVPEFEEAMNRLDELEVSAPLVSRFGVHLIQLMERRRVDLSPQEVREVARMELREQRYDKALQAWAQDVRNRAFIEYREAPQQ